MDMDQRTKDFGGRSGRIILLGDGTEVLTDSAETSTDMFDDAEDKDLESQVSKGQASTDDARGEREGTPGPFSADEDTENANSSGPKILQEPASIDDSPVSNKTEGSNELSEPKMTAATDTPLSSGQPSKNETS